MNIVLWPLLFALGGSPAPDTVVVCPPSFRAALQPWIAHRYAQGHRIRLLSNSSSPLQLRNAIRETARLGHLRYVLLVGDADPAAAFDESIRRRALPTHKATAKVNVRWGSEPEIATDNWYADLDDDVLPDVAVGRLPADSADELRRMVEKIIHYEQDPRPGHWRRRVSFIAGVGGFGPLIDSLIEMATRRFLTEGIPESYETSMTYGNWRSPFCPDPRRFHDTTLARLNEGCLFWIYMGHGNPTVLDRVRVPGHEFPILDVDDMDELRRTGGPPIALFLSCYTGAFDASRDCLAEELIRSPSGPVAAYCGSRVTMPYAMAVMGDALMHECFTSRRKTLGEVVLHAKRRMAQTRSPEEAQQLDTRYWLDMLASAVSGTPEQLADERLEHVLLFNLLGDPLLRLPSPGTVELQTEATAVAGESLRISGKTEVGGYLTVELVCRRDRTKVAPPRRRAFAASDAELAEYGEVYSQANDRRWAATTFRSAAGTFETELVVPADANGPCYVRAFAEGMDGHALGAAAITVRQPPPEERVASRPAVE